MREVTEAFAQWTDVFSQVSEAITRAFMIPSRQAPDWAWREHQDRIDFIMGSELFGPRDGRAVVALREIAEFEDEWGVLVDWHEVMGRGRNAD